MNLVVMAVVLAALASQGACRPQRPEDANAVVLEEANDTGFSPYRFSYRTSNGISRQESGWQDGEGSAGEGAYTWTSPEGYTYTITWTAGGGRGFHAKVPQLLPGPATPRGGPSGFPWARRR